MANDWLPMRLDLCDDPAVIAIAAACGLDEYATVGRLLKLWAWANRNTSDGNAEGNARGVTESWIDRYLSAPGFAASMLAAGWLSRAGGDTSAVLCFPKFERWNSQGAKRRALTARRVAKCKGRGSAEGNATGNAVGNAPSVSECVPKEEKRREEDKDKEPPNPPKGGVIAKTTEPVAIPPELNSPEFAAAWAEWLTARRARRKPLSDLAARRQLASLIPLGPTLAAECVHESIRNDWQGIFPKKFAGGSPRGGGSLFDHAAKTEMRIIAQVEEAMAAMGGSS